MGKGFFLSFLASVAILSAGNSAKMIDPEKVSALVKRFDASIPGDGYLYRAVRLSEKGDCLSPLIFLNGKSGYCGTGGCTVLITACDGKGGYRILGEPSVSDVPIYRASNSHHGYHNIKVYARKRGQVLLRYNGKAYPENASMAPTTKIVPGDRLILSEKDLEQ